METKAPARVRRSFSLILSLVPALVIIVLGVARALVLHDWGFQFSDNAFFYVIAKSLLEGEGMYQDIVHFRTPGLYFLSALFLKLFGVEMASQMLLLQTESYVLVPLIVYFCALYLLRSRLVAGAAGLLCVLLPGVLQLRAGLGLAAITLYIATQSGKRSRLLLVLTGFALGLTFIFGQEVAVLAVIPIVLWELRSHLRQPKALLSRGLFMLLGVAGALAPLLLYVVIKSDFGNFVYYTLVYAFTVARQSIDLPYPALSHGNAFYYLPFVLYLLAFANFHFSNRLKTPAVVLLIFGILRLASVIGRSDFLHLIFSIPEIFLVVPLSLLHIDDLRFDWKRVARFVLFGLALSTLFALSVTAESSFIVLSAPVIVLAAMLEEKGGVSRQPSRLATSLYVNLSGASLAVFVFLLAPTMWGVLREFQVGTNRPSDERKISGIRVSPQEETEIRTVERMLKGNRARTVLSYPYQPFYYALGPKHASRFLAFAEGMTEKEKATGIEDLEKNQPEVVIMERPYAEELSGVLAGINDYITSHYQTVQRIAVLHDLRLMVPKEQPRLEQHLALRMYELNKDKNVLGAYRTDQPDGSVLDHIRQIAEVSEYRITVEPGTVLELGVLKPPPGPQSVALADCGGVEIRNRQRTEEHEVCVNRRRVAIDLSGFAGSDATIRLIRTSGDEIYWMYPIIRAN